jgi:hypothetical protein
MKKNTLFGTALIIFFVAFSSGAKAQKIVNFNVALHQNKVMIKWATEKTDSADYFMVEKSEDGKNFKTVAYVLGADPALTNCECYGCFDKVAANAKKSYYRLKHVDGNGTVEFSEVKMLALK